MKQYTSKQLNEFSSLFSLVPSIAILDFNNDKNITTFLNNLIEPFEGSVSTVEFKSLTQIQKDIKRSSYDYGVIVNNLSMSSDIKLRFKIISLGLRDSGYIIILENKQNSLDDIYNMLEEFDFGAISTIDIFDNYNLIMGKKLHMWGM